MAVWAGEGSMSYPVTHGRGQAVIGHTSGCRRDIADDGNSICWILFLVVRLAALMGTILFLGAELGGSVKQLLFVLEQRASLSQAAWTV